MAAIPLRDVGKVIFVTRPRRGGVYLKRFSYPKGYTPPHLKSYMDSFTKAAGDCRGVMSGLSGKFLKKISSESLLRKLSPLTRLV